MSAITTSGLPDYQGMTLNDLKDGIRSENTKARSMARKSLEHVRTCGEMLIAMKGRVEHGSWICELKLIGIERKTASNYMRIAERWETVSHLNRGVKDALTLLCREDAPPTPAPSPRPSPASSKPPLPLGATYQDAEIVEPSAPDIQPEPQDDEPEPLVVDGTSDEIIEKENPWVTSRQAIAELAKLDGKISSPLGDVLAYIEKRWDLTFNLKVRK